MKQTLRTLTSFLFLLFLITGSVSNVQAGTVQHRFKIELPNGEVVPLAGGPIIHSVYKDNSGGDNTTVSDNCWYSGTKSDTEHAERLTADYQCVTPSGCDYSAFHSPIFPAGFNKAADIYETNSIKDLDDDENIDLTEASFAHFDPEKKSFTSRYPWAANYFKDTDPLGGESFYWKGEVAARTDYFRMIDGTKPSDALKGPFDTGRTPGGNKEAYVQSMDVLWPKVYWRKYSGNTPAGNPKNLDAYDIKTINNWSNESVLYNSVGRNQLHGSVTWIIKNKIPDEVIPKPTAMFTGKCANNTPGIPSYTYTLSNIDLKGQQFADNHLFLRIPQNAPGAADIKAYLGTPLYDHTSGSQTFGYSFIYNTTAPTNGVITLQLKPDEMVGNKPENKRTLKEFIEWLDSKGNSVPQNFDVATTLTSKTGDITNMNDYIKATFQPKFTNNECGQPAGGGDVPMCISVGLEYTDTARTGQSVVPSNLKIGDQVRAVCGTVAGAEYSFKVISPEYPNGLVSPQTSSNKSISMQINKAGSYIVQCGICLPGQPCKFDEVPDTRPTCTAPNSCVTPTGCEVGKTIDFKCSATGTVCCTSRTRDK